MERFSEMAAVLDQRYPHLIAYLERLESRPAFQKAFAS